MSEYAGNGVVVSSSGGASLNHGTKEEHYDQRMSHVPHFCLMSCVRELPWLKNGLLL